MYALNPDLNRTRSEFYAGNFTPHMFTNGFDSGSSLNSWLDDPKKYLNTVSTYEISFQGAKSDNTVGFEVTTNSMRNIDDSSDIRLFVATVMEKVVYPGSFNGMYEHKNVVIDQLLGNSGKKIQYIANSNYTDYFNWSMPEAWKNNSEIRWSNSNLKVVVWIQDFSSKEILQSSEFKF